MSLVASEVASRLLLTTRSIERAYRYREELRGRIATGGGVLSEGDRLQLRSWRAQHQVTDEEHEEALGAMGWTPLDYEAGWSTTTARAAAAKLRKRTGQGMRASADWLTSRLTSMVGGSSPPARA